MIENLANRLGPVYGAMIVNERNHGFDRRAERWLGSAEG
jgi:hypothetical protein